MGLRVPDGPYLRIPDTPLLWSIIIPGKPKVISEMGKDYKSLQDPRHRDLSNCCVAAVQPLHLPFGNGRFDGFVKTSAYPTVQPGTRMPWDLTKHA